jgi:hypothetical protein
VAANDITALKSLYDAFNRRDAAAISAVLDDRIEVDETEDLAYAAALIRVLGPRFMILSAAYKGKAEVQALFETVWMISEWFEVKPLDFQEIEDLIAVPLVLRAQSRNGDRAGGEAETAHLWTMRDGRATRLRVFSELNEAVAAARRDRSAAERLRGQARA